MKELKFRVWYRGRMVIRSLNDLVLESPPHYMFADSQVMQFTGLKDRDGNDVYEDDIYRNLDNGLIGRFYCLNGPGGYTLYCRENNTDGSPYNMLPFAQLDTTNFEVIGNIYENPELIKEK